MMRSFVLATCVVGFAVMPVSADLVDFENAADYGGDDAIVTADYFTQYGLQVRAIAGDDAASATEAVLAFEAAGKDGTDAYWGADGQRDNAESGDLGNFLLKAGTGDLSYNKSRYFNMSIAYEKATQAASGEVWDIDGNEQYKVTALDSNGNALASLTSPTGGLDAEPWSWSFDVGAENIAQIDVEFIGNSNLRGFAFDNFNSTEANAGAKVHAAPVPPAFAIGMVGFAGRALLKRRKQIAETIADSEDDSLTA